MARNRALVISEQGQTKNGQIHHYPSMTLSSWCGCKTNQIANWIDSSSLLSAMIYNPQLTMYISGRIQYLDKTVAWSLILHGATLNYFEAIKNCTDVIIKLNFDYGHFNVRVKVTPYHNGNFILQSKIIHHRCLATKGLACCLLEHFLACSWKLKWLIANSDW